MLARLGPQGQLLALVTPVLAVIALRAMWANGPIAANAAPQTPVNIEQPSAPLAASVSDEQKRAIQWLAAQSISGELLSPLNHVPAPIEAPAPAEKPAVAAPRQPGEAPLPVFKITAILGNADEALAIVNGKVVRLGDVLAAGFAVTLIDAAGGRVELVDESGRTMTLTTQKASPER